MLPGFGVLMGRQLLASVTFADIRAVAALDAGNVRKMVRRVCAEAGIGASRTPRELRTSFVSLMSHHGVSIEVTARLVGRL
ncbi:MAG: hypothetical protein ABSB76_10430 [Streptosporangiaceae bacterium]|jgi:site-specific recombinase XerD